MPDHYLRKLSDLLEHWTFLGAVISFVFTLIF
jgi:hypothetical protein